MDGRYDRRYRAFLQLAWIFIGYNLLGMLIGWLEALPASNGSQGSVNNVGYQAITGNGTALSPPLFLLVIVIVAGIAATRSGWFRRIGAFGVWFYAGFYASAGELGELTTTTSPLTGIKWDLVLVLGALGIALAATVLGAGLWTLIGALRSRTRRPNRPDEHAPADSAMPSSSTSSVSEPK